MPLVRHDYNDIFVDSIVLQRGLALDTLNGAETDPGQSKYLAVD